MEMEEGAPPPFTEQEKQDKATLSKVAPILFVAVLTLIAITAGLTLSGTVNLAGRTDSLPNFGSRLEFTFKYQTFPALCLIVLLINVIVQRGRTGALNPLNGRDVQFQKYTNILQNTFEQFILSAFAQVILVSFIDGEWTMRSMPLVNFLFVIGRITFYFGYPNYRTFGIMCSILPTCGMLGVAVYKFFEHLFF